MADEAYRDYAWRYIDMGAEKALPLLQPLAAAGDAVAQYTLAFMYGKGDGGVSEDRAVAEYWLGQLTELAEAGDAQAQFILYEMYYFGPAYREWVDLDPDRAFYWLRKAAQSGVGGAQYALSGQYQSGEPPWVRKDPEMEEFWFRKALEQEYPDAVYYQAMRLLDEDGIPRGEALRLLTIAAKRGIRPAADFLKRVKD